MSETVCANCGRPIRAPKRGSYPDGVKWVHVRSEVGINNRWCRLGDPATIAEPSDTRKASQ